MPLEPLCSDRPCKAHGIIQHKFLLANIYFQFELANWLAQFMFAKRATCRLVLFWCLCYWQVSIYEVFMDSSLGDAREAANGAGYFCIDRQLCGWITHHNTYETPLFALVLILPGLWVFISITTDGQVSGKRIWWTRERRIIFSKGNSFQSTAGAEMWTQESVDGWAGPMVRFNIWESFKSNWETQIVVQGFPTSQVQADGSTEKLWKSSLRNYELFDRQLLSWRDSLRDWWLFIA